MKSTNIILLSIALFVLIWSCEKETILSNNDFEAKLSDTDTYTQDLQISGDEEGAIIIKQANHFEISELKRDASTNWSIVYFYKPEVNFSGADSILIETCIGGDGTTCSVIDTVKIVFLVTN